MLSRRKNKENCEDNHSDLVARKEARKKQADEKYLNREAAKRKPRRKASKGQRTKRAGAVAERGRCATADQDSGGRSDEEVGTQEVKRNSKRKLQTDREMVMKMERAEM